VRRRHISCRVVHLVARLEIAAAAAGPQQIRRLREAPCRAAAAAAAAASPALCRGANVLGLLPLMLIALILDPGRLAALAPRLAVAAVPVERLS